MTNTNGGFYVTGREIYDMVKLIDSKLDQVEQSMLEHMEETLKTMTKLEIKFYGLLAGLLTTIIAELLIIVKLLADGGL